MAMRYKPGGYTTNEQSEYRKEIEETSMNDDIAQRALDKLEGITPYPWDWMLSTTRKDSTYHVVDCEDEDVVTIPYGFAKDAAFIAAAPQLVADLADEVDRLRQRVADRAKKVEQLRYDVGQEIDRGDGYQQDLFRSEQLRDRDRNAVQRLRELHNENPEGGCDSCWDCVNDEPEVWPCATIRALDGDGYE